MIKLKEAISKAKKVSEQDKKPDISNVISTSKAWIDLLNKWVDISNTWKVEFPKKRQSIDRTIRSYDAAVKMTTAMMEEFNQMKKG